MRCEHPENALFPIDVNSGRFTVVILEQPKNANLLTIFNFGRLTVFSLSQLQKAPLLNFYYSLSMLSTFGL